MVKLAEFAMSQPHTCYAAFTFGLRHRWTYFLKTLPDIEDLLEPLERATADVLIPSITDHHCTTPSERDPLALPVTLGGLGIINPSQDADLQYQAPMKTTAPLVKKIVSQAHETQDDAIVYPNADSYRDLDLKQIYKQQENNKKRLYAQRLYSVLEGQEQLEEKLEAMFEKRTLN